eukprot:ctg_350.g200
MSSVGARRRGQAATATEVDAEAVAAEAERIRAHQAQLATEKLAESRARALGDRTVGKGASDDGGRGADGDGRPRTLDQYIAYPSADAYPAALRPRQLHVDMEREVLLVPINGVPVPFHVATIKNASKSEESGFAYLRINFHVPGAGSSGVGGGGGTTGPERAVVSVAAGEQPERGVAQDQGAAQALHFARGRSAREGDAGATGTAVAGDRCAPHPAPGGCVRAAADRFGWPESQPRRAGGASERNAVSLASAAHRRHSVRQREARIFPGGQERGGGGGAFSPAHADHGGQAQDRGCAVLHRGDGLNGAAGAREPQPPQQALLQVHQGGGGQVERDHRVRHAVPGARL